MARSFNGTSDFLQNSNAPLTATPLTISLWFWPSVAEDAVLCGIGARTVALTSNNSFELLSRQTGQHVRAAINNTTSNATTTDSVAAYNVGAWNHASATFTGTSGQGAGNELNGTVIAPTGTVRTPTGVDTLYLGARAINNTHNNFLNGRLAELGIWNVQLTSNELKALANGVPPLRVRPSGLVVYCPLQGLSSPEPDFNQGVVGSTKFTLTLTGTAQTNHAPTQLWTRKAITPPDTSGAVPDVLLGQAAL